MDSIKLEKLITENMKAIYGFSLTKLKDVNEADYLASDIIYEIIRSAQNLKNEASFYGFMWKIAENTYMDYLRKKVKERSLSAELDDNVADNSSSVIDDIVEKERLELLYRELSLLSKQYRETTVLYYIENFSCHEIAEKLNISAEMVKYYLFRARKIIREGMNMDRSYGEKSYRPDIFEIDFWGNKAGDDREYQDFYKRKIKGNILLAAYYSPVTIQEISIELGVSLPYLEDEIKLLEDRQYLVRRNGKYLTNIPIFTLDCTKAINEKLADITNEAAQKLIAVTDGFQERFGSQFSNENIARWQKVLLCLHFSLNKTANDLKKRYGEFPSDGPYSFVNGGGGKGIIWGRCKESVDGEDLSNIQGIYNGSPSSNRRGSVIAMNFKQTLNAQRFEGNMTDHVVDIALDNYAHLPENWQVLMKKLGYTLDGKPNFPVYTIGGYEVLSDILKESVDIVSALNRKTSEVAATVTADLAPTHIRKTAEHVGALVYRFNSLENLVNRLFEMNWLKAAADSEKPAICVIKN